MRHMAPGTLTLSQSGPGSSSAYSSARSEVNLGGTVLIPEPGEGLGRLKGLQFKGCPSAPRLCRSQSRPPDGTAYKGPHVCSSTVLRGDAEARWWQCHALDQASLPQLGCVGPAGCVTSHTGRGWAVMPYAQAASTSVQLALRTAWNTAIPRSAHIPLPPGRLPGSTAWFLRLYFPHRLGSRTVGH